MDRIFLATKDSEDKDTPTPPLHTHAHTHVYIPYTHMYPHMYIRLFVLDSDPILVYLSPTPTPPAKGKRQDTLKTEQNYGKVKRIYPYVIRYLHIVIYWIYVIFLRLLIRCHPYSLIGVSM